MWWLHAQTSGFDIMAEGVGIRSRPEDYLWAPARGPSPLAPSRRASHPVKGAHPLQNPRSNPTPFYLMARDIMEEGVGIRSRTEGGLRAPARGPNPLAPSRCSGHPMKGAHPLHNPRFESHPVLSYGA